MTPNPSSSQGDCPKGTGKADRVSTKEHNQTPQAHEIIDVQQVNCCIVGGEPAGTVLALLLARQGIAVTLLEAHRDFDRDFRGDTLQPSAMEIMAQMGLADRLLELPHSKLHSITLRAPDGSVIFSPSFYHLKTDYPYVKTLWKYCQSLRSGCNSCKTGSRLPFSRWSRATFVVGIAPDCC